MSKSIGRIFGNLSEVNSENYLSYVEDFLRRNVLNNYSTEPINDMTNNTNSGYGLSLQPDTLSAQGKQYAQMAAPNTATDATTTPQVDYSLYGSDFSQEFIDQMLNDARFQQIMRNRTQENEGGYSNNPNDRGGETKYGISSRWYPNEDIKNLTRERADALLYRDYWLAPRINQLPDEFADIVFDDGVVQGQPTAIRNLQKALGTHVDGLIGPNTLNAFQNANYNTVRRNFIHNVNDVEDEYLQNDPSQRIFERGHRKRFNKY